MKHQIFFSFSLLFLFFFFTQTTSQSPAAAPVQVPVLATPPPVQVPPSHGYINVANILEGAGHFSVFTRLLKATDSNSELVVELNHTHNGVTIFAPTDAAFSGLQAGTLNSLTDQEKVKLVKFHIVPIFLSGNQFQTVSNPLKTQAGKGGRLTLNVTTTGSSVNISTGVTNTTISGNVYNDNQLAIYQVDQVLQPMELFAPNLPPAPAPSPVHKAHAHAGAPAASLMAPPPEKPKKAPVVESPPTVSINDVSAAMSSNGHIDTVMLLAAGAVAAMFSL
ncbi:fasciclin-like arabinogalactan protein 12 [Euphorbia lathyris]|uniref:fasciclin-like arabinogalactan protein 12 n=1 Tax=Euphorbia lathyris TaxID=212925 RepID=UPI003313B7C2